MLLFRKERLQESHQLQLFKANQRLLLDWNLKQSNEMAKKGLPKSKTEAESFILEHQNWKVFKNGRLFFLFLCVLIFFCKKYKAKYNIFTFIQLSDALIQSNLKMSNISSDLS